MGTKGASVLTLEGGAPDGAHEEDDDDDAFGRMATLFGGGGGLMAVGAAMGDAGPECLPVEAPDAREAMLRAQIRGD